MIIRDIRFCESGMLDGQPYSQNLGTLFPFPYKISWMGECVARKLRESDFSLGDYDHLFVNFCSFLPHGECELLPDSAEPWYRVCNCGLSPEAFAQMDGRAGFDFARDTVRRVLTRLVPERGAEIASVCAAFGFDDAFCDIVYCRTENEFGRAELLLRYFSDGRPGRAATAALLVNDFGTDGVCRQTEVLSRRELYRALRRAGGLALSKNSVLVRAKASPGEPAPIVLDRQRV